MIETFHIQGIGDFLRVDNVMQHMISFRGQTVPVMVYPKDEAVVPEEDWKESMRQLFSTFLASQEREMKRLPDLVRKLCHDYEMYDGRPIPWSDDDLMDGLEFNNIKLCDYNVRTKEGLIQNHRFVECSTEPSLKRVNNFSILFGFENGVTLEYAHFDG